MRSRFLAVDLAIESRSNLAPLAAEFGERVLLHHCGPIPRPKGNLLALSTWRQHKGPDPAIHALCVLVETLSPAGSRLWQRAKCKEFDIGYDLERTDRSIHFTLRTDTLQRVATLGATIGVTCYRPTDEERAARAKELAQQRRRLLRLR